MLLDTPVHLHFENVPFELTASAEGGFVAHNDDLQLAVIGATEQEAIQSFRDGVRDLVAYCMERHLPLPDLLRPG